MSNFSSAEHALATGMILGQLMNQHGTPPLIEEVHPVVDDAGDYTRDIRVKIGSYWYNIEVAPEGAPLFRIYDPYENEPADVRLSQLLRMAGLDYIYYHDDDPKANDSGWYLRPKHSWQEASEGTDGPDCDAICQSAMYLLSDESENAEYDRAIGELLTETLGLPIGDGQPQRVIDALRRVRDESAS